MFVKKSRFFSSFDFQKSQWSVVFLLCSSLTATAQNLHLANNTTVTKTTGVEAAPLKNQHLLPLFGEVSKTMAQIELEIKFLSDCDRDFENRTDACKFFVERGWDYLRESQLDTATYRFNLAYLLDPKNVETYWGLGVVCFQKGHYADAERILRKGIDIDSSNVGLLVDLATVDLIHYKENKEEFELLEADKLLSRALNIDNTNANTHLKKAVLEFHKCHYEAAWVSIHKTRELDAALLDIEFITELMAKQSDPLRIFGEKK